jgi:hypothetical protein
VSKIKAVRHGCAFASSIRSWSRPTSAVSFASSATIGASPFPDRTCMPAVDGNADRGTSVRSSTNCFAGTSTARSTARSPASWTSPRTQAGCPQPRKSGAGAVSVAVR